jgi:hypothetical protein
VQVYERYPGGWFHNGFPQNKEYFLSLGLVILTEICFPISAICDHFQLLFSPK